MINKINKMQSHHPGLSQQIHETLAREHSGKKLGIKSNLLARKIGISERYLRRIISQLREQGVAIVGVPETGYYLAETPNELEECCNFLHNRALHSLVIEAQLRRISLPALWKQMRLTQYSGSIDFFRDRNQRTVIQSQASPIHTTSDKKSRANHKRSVALIN